MSDPPIIYKKSTNILFSVSFALLLPLVVLIFPLFMILFNLIFLPFSIIHEVGHFITSFVLLPSHEPVLHFNIIKGELTCTCDLSQELMCCLNSIIVVLGGTGSVILFVLIFLILLTKIEFLSLGKLYLLFGLLSDLPNLFPILPSVIRSPTDGFIIYSFLSRMGFLPPLSSGVSYFFSLSSFIVVLISFYFLGSFFFQLLISFLKEKPESKTTQGNRVLSTDFQEDSF